jgi:uncharacterized ion transporter superfamily protein YfcC
MANHAQPMTGAAPAPLPTVQDRFPTAYTILFALIVLMAALTWVLPAGQYERTANEALGKDAPVPGTYQVVDAAPQGVLDVLMAPITGFYNQATGVANAIDVSLFVLVIGGFLGVVNATGAINTGIERIMLRMQGREKWMIPVLMLLFAAGGTTYGMAEETLAFYVLLLPLMIAVGYDALTGVAVIMVGAGIGVLGSTINPFSTAIASNAAGIPFTQGMALRLVILALGWLICVAYVMRYAERVRKDPSRSLVADLKADNEAHFLRHRESHRDQVLTGRQQIILVLFGATFVAMVWGVALRGWWMAEMSALFLASAIAVGLVAWMGEKPFTNAFVDGSRELLGVALVIGLARGIVVIMDQGKIVNALFATEGLLSLLVPSTSGLAVLSMPILAPLSDFAGVPRDLAVTAFQTAIGITNLVTPTYAVVVGALAIGRVPYQRWVRFIWPLMLMLALLSMASLSAAVLL